MELQDTIKILLEYNHVNPSKFDFTPILTVTISSISAIGEKVNKSNRSFEIETN